MAVADAALRFDLLLNDKTGKGVSSAGSNFGKLAKAGLAIGAVGAAIGSSISKAADFDKTIRIAGAAADATGAQMADMSKLALDLGTKTQFGAQGAADAMVELSKSGLTIAQQKAGALVETMNLASAGGLELGNAATYMTNALNTFGLSADKASQVSTALAGGANASTASVESLGLALSQVGPGAKNAGLSLQDTVGVLAAFDQAGIKGSDAGTSLKTMLTRLIPTTKKASQEAKALGLSFTNADGSFKSITQIAGILQDKFKGMSEASRTAALSTIFGSDATRAATVLINDGAKGLQKYIDATKDRSALEKQVAAQTGGAAGAMRKFKSAVDSLQIALAINLLPAVSDVVGGLSGFINQASSKVGPAVGVLTNVINKKAKPAFRELKDVASDALSGVDFTGVGKQLATEASAWAGNLIGGVKDGFDKGDWSGVGSSVGTGISKALANTAEISTKLTVWLGAQIEKIKWGELGVKAGKAAPALLVGLAIGILNFDIGSVLSTLGNHWFEAILGVLTVAFAFAKFGPAIAALLDRIPIVGGLLRWIFNAVGKASVGIAKAGLDLLGALGRGIVAGIAKEFPAAGRLLDGAAGKLIYELRFKALQFTDAAASWGRALLAGLTSLPGRLAGKAGEVIGGFLGGLARGGVKVDAWAGGFGARIVRAVGNLGGILRGAGRELIQGFINGIGDMFGSVKSKLGDLTNKVTSWKGPPTKDKILLRPAGQAIIGGLINGFEDRFPDVKAALEDLTGTIQQRFDEAKDFTKGIRDAFKGLGNLPSIDTILTDAAGKQTEGGLPALLAGLKKQAADATAFVATMKRLRKAGLNETSLTGLREAGPDNGLKAAQQLLAGGSAAIGQVNQLQSSLNKTGQVFSNRETRANFGFAGMPNVKATDKGQKVELHVNLAGGGDKFMNWLRDQIRVKGGNVQLALGK